MDAGLNDNIYFDIKYLKNVKLVIGVGFNFQKKDLDNQTFLFTEQVNTSGGYIKFPFNYKAYIVI